MISINKKYASSKRHKEVHTISIHDAYLLVLIMPAIFSDYSGPLSIAVPSEIKGYWVAHQRYGRMPWSALFRPAIDMAAYGFPVPIGLHKAIQDDRELLLTEPSLRSLLHRVFVTSVIMF